MAANKESGDALRFCNRIPAEASQYDKVAFAAYFLSNFQRQDLHGDSLPEHFAEDFALLSVQDDKAIHSGTTKNLRGPLRVHGFYVPERPQHTDGMFSASSCLR